MEKRMQTQYGIKKQNNLVAGRDVVRCNNGWHYFYDELIDMKKNDTLVLFQDGKDFFYKGCPICETDAYLMDVPECFKYFYMKDSAVHNLLGIALKIGWNAYGKKSMRISKCWFRNKCKFLK